MYVCATHKEFVRLPEGRWCDKCTFPRYIDLPATSKYIELAYQEGGHMEPNKGCSNSKPG